MVTLIEYNLRNAEQMRDVIIRCRRARMSTLDYLPRMMTFAQNAIDRERGVSRKKRNLKDMT